MGIKYKGKDSNKRSVLELTLQSYDSRVLGVNNDYRSSCHSVYHWSVLLFPAKINIC